MQAKRRRVHPVVLAINALTLREDDWSLGLPSRSSYGSSGALDNLGDALTYALSLAVVGAGARAKAQAALIKGGLICSAAVAVGIQIAWRLANPAVPLLRAWARRAVESCREPRLSAVADAVPRG